MILQSDNNKRTDDPNLYGSERILIYPKKNPFQSAQIRVIRSPIGAYANAPKVQIPLKLKHILSRPHFHFNTFRGHLGIAYRVSSFANAIGILRW